MKTTRLMMCALALLFALLMSIPFLIPGMGWVALFAFVPLLMMDSIADTRKVRHFFWWHYMAFVLWNAATTFWVCNATVGGGIFAVLANAAQMSLVWALFRLSKKRFDGLLPYVFLAAMWIAWERLYFSAQISWPWLTLGNAFAGNVRLVQWYEYTGALGGSLWIWMVNIWLFFITRSLWDGTRRRASFRSRAISNSLFALLVIAPMALSMVMFSRYEENSDESVEVVIAQPDFDPYEKFVSLTQAQQNVILLDLFEKGLAGRDSLGGALLLLAPETFTSDIVIGRQENSPTWQKFQSFLAAHPDANLLFGASTLESIGESRGRSHTARKLRDGNWYESHNSAFVTDASGRCEVFQKSKLVVGVEMMPYPAFFDRIDKWLGGVMGRCVGQDVVTALNIRRFGEGGGVEEEIPIGSIICYESVYGEYCTGYVKAGARALAVITNDAWWGDTPGYRQHLRYASLRAIETRRDIARCANTGISGFINQRGEILERSDWWKREYLVGRINLNDGQTFFVRYGDITGRICTLMFLMLLLALVVRFVTAGRIRKPLKESKK